MSGTDFSDGGRRRYDTSIPASVRHNNPGASYPASWMSKYGMDGHSVIGGGHKIAYFPTAAQGAASNFELFDRGYVGKSVGDAINKWSGGNSPRAYANTVAQSLGVTPETVVTRDMWRNPDFAVPMLSSMAKWEKGPRGQQFDIPDSEWRQAHAMYLGAPVPQTTSQTVMSRERTERPAPMRQQAQQSAFSDYKPATWKDPNTVQWSDGSAFKWGNW